MPIGKIEWCNNPQDGCAVVTGCDSNHEWMLPWWYSHYNNHNKYPIYFADFGMTKEMRKWCKLRGTIIDLTASIGKLNWFKKPLAILSIPHTRIIWTDIDCEIRKSLKLLVKHAGNLCVTADKHNRWIKHKKVVASGVIVVNHGNPIIVKWAEACLAKTKLRGDQEVLNDIVARKPNKVSIMPLEYQWLRVDGNNPKAIIMHWTGFAGKRIIKRAMGIGKDPSLPFDKQPVKRINARHSLKLRSKIKSKKVKRTKQIRRTKRVGPLKLTKPTKAKMAVKALKLKKIKARRILGIQFE